MQASAVLAWIIAMYPFLLFLFTPYFGQTKCVRVHAYLYLNQASMHCLQWIAYPLQQPIDIQQVFPMLDCAPIYGSSSIAFDLWTSHRLLCTCVEIWSELFIFRYSDMVDFNECSFIGNWFIGSGQVDSVLSGAHPLKYAFYAKIYVFINPALQTIMYMWLPLARYIFLLHVLLHCVFPREFLWPQTVVFNNMSWKLVHCIKNSNAKCSLNLLINFTFCALFSFICFRTVEACTPY